MAGTLGTIRGQMLLDVKQALSAYTAVRLANLQTVTALHTGAGALQRMGAGMTLAGVGLLAGLKVAADAAANFERRMDYVGAVTAATGDQMDALREKAIQLGQDTIYSAGDIADSFVELAKAGVEPRDIINGIGEAVANLGAAAEVPLDTAATIIMSAVQTFRLASEDAVGVADKLAGAANASIVEVQDLGLSLKYAGGVASNLGADFDETLTALALLGTYGIRGSTAGTSLRQTLISLSGRTAKATTQLRELGIITEDGTNRFYDANGSAKSLAEVFQILQDATRGMTDEAKLASLRDIFQVRALPTVMALLNEGADGFDRMAEAIGKTTAADVASERLDNLSGDVEILRGNLETLAIENGSTLQAFLRGLVQGITDVVQWFTNLDESTQATIIKIVGITGVILTIVGFLGMFAGAIMNIVALIIQMGPVWTLLGKGITLVAGAFRALTAAMIANPIVLIIVAIIALVAGFIWLWNNVEGFRNFFIQAWEWIKNAAEAVVDWFAGLPAFFSNIWNNITTWTTNAWQGILDFFASIPQRIMDFFLNWTLPGLLIQHWDSIWLTITTVWNNILMFFQQLPTNIANFFAELPGKIGYWIGFMIGTVLRLIMEFNTNAWNFITTAWDNIVTFFSELPGRVQAFFVDLHNRVINWLTQLAINAIVWVLKTRDDMVKFFSELPGKIAGFFSDMYNRVVSWLTQTYNNARTRASQILQGIVSFLQQLPGRVAQFFQDVYNNIVNKFTDAKNRALEIGSNIYTGIRDAITGLPGLVSGIFDNVVSAVRDAITGAFNAVRDFASGLWEGFKDGLGIHSPSYIEEAMWQITDVVGSETAAMRDQVRNLQRLGNNIVDLGNNVGSGFGEGVEESLRLLERELARSSMFEKELASLAATSTIGLSTPGTSGLLTQAPVVVQAGDNISLEVDWHAAPDDNINTRQQAKNLLGRASTILGDGAK